MGIRDALLAKYGQLSETVNVGDSSSSKYSQGTQKTFLAKSVTYLTGVDGKPLAAAEYFGRMQLPTLAELYHAYFDKNPDGSWAHPEFRQSVLSMRGHGEWTSTFLRNGRVIERPERIFCDKNGLWKAEGGRVTRVRVTIEELPDYGWILEYNNGFPSAISQNEKDAKCIFGSDTSFFTKNKYGLRAILWCFSTSGGPNIYADRSLDKELSSFYGGRACLRNSVPANPEEYIEI